MNLLEAARNAGRVPADKTRTILDTVWKAYYNLSTATILPDTAHRIASLQILFREVTSVCVDFQFLS
jgi:hypothetical protein